MCRLVLEITFPTKGTGRTVMLKLNYQMKYAVNLLGGNRTLNKI